MGVQASKPQALPSEHQLSGNGPPCEVIVPAQPAAPTCSQSAPRSSIEYLRLGSVSIVVSKSATEPGSANHFAFSARLCRLQPL